MNAQTPRISRHSPFRDSIGHALLAGLVTVAVALIVTGCGSTSSISKQFSSKYLSFRYPANWHARTTGLVNTSMYSDIVALSPQPMHNSCKVSRTRTVESITCHSPISHLQPNSVLAIWMNAGSPGWTISRTPAQNIKVGGISGKWDVSSAANDYPSDGATQQVNVVVPIPHEPGNYYVLHAEVRGPDTTKLIAELRAMVETVRWRPAS